MEYLTFHTEELPEMAEAGARYVVVACCGIWRDGEVTNDAAQIATLKKQLRKRFMKRFSVLSHTSPNRITTASFRSAGDGDLERL